MIFTEDIVLGMIHRLKGTVRRKIIYVASAFKLHLGLQKGMHVPLCAIVFVREGSKISMTKMSFEKKLRVHCASTSNLEHTLVPESYFKPQAWY